jgi:hypothetical protein
MHFKATLPLTPKHSVDWEEGDVVVVSGDYVWQLSPGLSEGCGLPLSILDVLLFHRSFEIQMGVARNASVVRIEPIDVTKRVDLCSPFVDLTSWYELPYGDPFGEAAYGFPGPYAYGLCVGEGTPAAPRVEPFGFVRLLTGSHGESEREFGCVDVQIDAFFCSVLVDVTSVEDRVERLIRCSEWCLNLDLRSGPIVILDAELQPLPDSEYRPLAATVSALSEFWKRLREGIRSINTGSTDEGVFSVSARERAASTALFGPKLVRDFLGLHESLLPFESDLLRAAQVVAAPAVDESGCRLSPMVFGRFNSVGWDSDRDDARPEMLAKILLGLPNALLHARQVRAEVVVAPAVLLFSDDADDCRKLVSGLQPGFDVSKSEDGKVTIWHLRRRSASTLGDVYDGPDRIRREPPAPTDARATTPWTGGVAAADGNKAQQPAWLASGLIRNQYAGPSERNGLEMALSVQVPRHLGALLGGISRNPGDPQWLNGVAQVRGVSEQALSLAPTAYQRPRSVAPSYGSRAPHQVATSSSFDVRVLGVTGNALDACVCGVRADTHRFVRLGNQPTGKFIGDALAHFRKGLLVRVTASQVQGRGPFQEAWLLESSEPLSTEVDADELPAWLLDAGVVERCAPEALFDSGLTVKDQDLCLSEWGYANTSNSLCVWQPPVGVSLRRKLTNEGEFYELAVRRHVVRLRNLSLDPGPEVLDHRHLLGLTITQRGRVRLGGWYALT